MKPEGDYLKYVRWSEEDAAYVGYCPDLFPWSGVCHADTEEECYHLLCGLVREELQDLRASGAALPPLQTRPMREAVVS
jgi:hypothetical protein